MITQRSRLQGQSAPRRARVERSRLLASAKREPWKQGATSEQHAFDDKRRAQATSPEL